MQVVTKFVTSAIAIKLMTKQRAFRDADAARAPKAARR